MSIPAPHKLRVLLVEHDDDDSALFLAALSSGGFDVDAHIIATAPEVRKALEQSRYDVVLSGYRLPGWTGMDALRLLRDSRCDTPFILVTGALDEERAVDCLKEGASDYIMKNSLLRLPVAITRALEDGRLREERALAMDALRTSQEQLRLLLDSTAEGIYGIDLAGICTFCNTAAARMLRYAGPEGLLGKNVHDLVHHTRRDGSPYPESECPIFHAFRTGEGVRLESEVLWRQDGTPFDADYFSHPIRKDGAIVGAVVTFLDVTEKRRMEGELLQKEARFRQLTEASFEGVAVSDNGIVLEANAGFADIFGYSVDEIIGRSTMDFVAPESLETVTQQVRGNFEGRYDLVGKKKDGRKLILEVAGRTVTGDGRTQRITAIRDITEKRHLEEQVRQSQKMEAVGRLAGGVAHDFNNLLTVILSYTDMLMEDIGPKDPRAADLSEIRKAVVGASSLTRQLLAFSRQQVIEPRLVGLTDIVSASVKMLRRLIGEDVMLLTNYAPIELPVMIDPGQLEQVILNLAVNARDAMPTGGTLTLETATATLDDVYARDHWPIKPGRYAMLAVSDTGSGMDEATRARIFEPFFTTKQVGNGTGLGLATVYGIVKQSNGFIWVYSELDQGTTFKIYLPLVAEEAERPTEEAPVVARGGSETILLAEDATAVREATRQMLQRFGYTVIEAPNGAAALGAAQGAGRIDLLLTDVVMPGMSGRELAERLAEIRPEIPALFMSGYTDDAIVRHGLLPPRIAYLQKPFSPDALARKVREVLDRPRQQRATPAHRH
jgi:PAS domain S-box-containing protein